VRRRSTWSQPAFSITNTIDAAQQVTQITSTLNDATDPGTLAANITYYYYPFGAIGSVLHGCVGTNCLHVQESYAYNNRLQPVVIDLGNTVNGVSAENCLVYNYYSGYSNPTSCTLPQPPQDGSVKNNGNVKGYLYQDTSYTSLGHTMTYGYDSLNRLTNDMATGGLNQSYMYDAFGNLNCPAGSSPQFTCDAANHLTNVPGYTLGYDAAGNVTCYAYDGLHRVTSITYPSG
jgi:YD repeat-containing protein